MKNIVKELMIVLVLLVSFSYLPTFYAANSTSNMQELEEFQPPEDNQSALTCTDILGSIHEEGSVFSIINSVYIVMKIAAVLIVIVLSMLDFSRAIAQSDQDALSKSLKKFTTRLILLVAFFLVPTFLRIILDVAFGGNTGCL